MPKLKPEELEARRMEILEAARTCFLRSGFHQTTTDQICHEANITPGGLYHYFTSKDELIAEVIEHSAWSALERMRKVVEEADDTESAFRQAAGFLYQAMHDPDVDNIARLDLEIWAESQKNEKLAERNSSMWALRIRWLEALVERGIKDGLLDAETVKPRGMSSLLLSVYIGMRTGRLLLGDEFDTDGAIGALMQLQGARTDLAEMQMEAN